MYTYGIEQMTQVMWGAALLGSGGGGGIATGQAFIASMPSDASVTVVDAAELNGRDCSVAAFLGSPSAGAQADPTALLSAYDRLGATPCVIPGEIGPGNSLSPMLVAVNRPGVVVANGDGAGRALPKLSMATFNTGTTPPMVISNGAGIDISIDTAVPIDSADAILRAIVSERTVFGQVGGLALWKMDSAAATGCTIWGTLEATRQLGQAILGDTTIGNLVTLLGQLGWPVVSTFSGTLSVGRTVTAGGFDVGSAMITDGKTQTLFLENENMLSWMNNSDDAVAAPYSLCYWDNETKRPFTNVEASRYVGKQVTVLVLTPRPPVLSQPNAMKGYLDFLPDFGYAGTVPGYVAMPPSGGLHGGAASVRSAYGRAR